MFCPLKLDISNCNIFKNELIISIFSTLDVVSCFRNHWIRAWDKFQSENWTINNSKVIISIHKQIHRPKNPVDIKFP